jgi:hypothetical protein
MLVSLSNLTDLELHHRFRKEEMDVLVEGLHGSKSIKTLCLGGL